MTKTCTTKCRTTDAETAVTRLALFARKARAAVGRTIRAGSLHCLALAAFAATASTARADNLLLTVDPFSGATSVVNASASVLSLDGYVVTSNSGELQPGTGNWQSLTAAGLPGWQVAAASTGALSELNLTSSTSVPAESSVSLGNAFTPNGTEDLQFGYSTPTGTVVQPATVQYASALTVEIVNLLGNNGSTIAATNAVLVNLDPVSSTFDGYVVQSASGSLQPGGFQGLSAAGVTGWDSVAPSASALTELNLTGSITLAPNHDFALGSMFTSGAAHDLTLQYDLIGTGPYAGSVTYKNQLAGDANGDGIVNGQDISLVASNWLHSGTLPGDANYDGIVNGQDIALIASHWLQSYGGGSGLATSVPEPSTLVLAAIIALVLVRRPSFIDW